MHGYKNARHGDAPYTYTCILFTYGSRELKTQIISEVTVKKMVIKVDAQMHDACWIW